MRMERELSKDEIFELYLNKSFFGNRAYGVAAAAEFYYGKTLDQLTPGRDGLAGRHPEVPVQRQSAQQPRARQGAPRLHPAAHGASWASSARPRPARRRRWPMHARPHERPVEVYAPYVAEMVRQEMIARFGAEALTKGYHVTTTSTRRCRPRPTRRYATAWSPTTTATAGTAWSSSSSWPRTRMPRRVGRAPARHPDPGRPDAGGGAVHAATPARPSCWATAREVTLGCQAAAGPAQPGSAGQARRPGARAGGDRAAGGAGGRSARRRGR